VVSHKGQARPTQGIHRVAFRHRARRSSIRRRQRAVALSHEKYCSATVMLAATAKITHETVVEQI
jgi:uncharacterized OsmC-like protein